LDGAEDGDAQAANPGGSSSGERRDFGREAQAEAVEETSARQVVDVDPGAALTAHLEREVAKGFSIETRSETQAVIGRSRRRWWRLRTMQAERQVLSVDEHGYVQSCSAEPVR
jgi:hypothetical protein